VGFTAVLDAMVKRKIPSRWWDSNLRQSRAYITELSWLIAEWKTSDIQNNSLTAVSLQEEEEEEEEEDLDDL
jgi:hypothetical protein